MADRLRGAIEIESGARVTGPVAGLPIFTAKFLEKGCSLPPDDRSKGRFSVRTSTRRVSRFWQVNRANPGYVGKSQPERRDRDRLKAGKTMATDYIERREGSFYLIGSRLPLARVVYEFQNGAAPEAIRLDYPTLSLEQVYGAITFYLANMEEVEQDMVVRRRIRKRSSRPSRLSLRNSGKTGTRAGADAVSAKLIDDPLHGGRRSQRRDSKRLPSPRSASISWMPTKGFLVGRHNRSVRCSRSGGGTTHVAGLLGVTMTDFSSAQMTYDPRRQRSTSSWPLRSAPLWIAWPRNSMNRSIEPSHPLRLPERFIFLHSLRSDLD